MCKAFTFAEIPQKDTALLWIVRVRQAYYALLKSSVKISGFGKSYINKRGEIKFEKLVTGKIECEIFFSVDEIDAIMGTIENKGKVVFTLELFIKNPDGNAAATVTFDFY